MCFEANLYFSIVYLHLGEVHLVLYDDLQFNHSL